MSYLVRPINTVFVDSMGHVGLVSQPNTCSFFPVTGSSLNHVSFFLPTISLVRVICTNSYESHTFFHEFAV
jgi:hypothetical protein